MKKIIIFSIILIIIIGAGIWENIFIKDTFSEFNERMLEIGEYIENDDSQSALVKTQELTVWWKKKLNVIEVVAYSPDIRLVSVTLAELEGSLKINDIANSQSKHTSILALALNIENILDFNLKDVF